MWTSQIKRQPSGGLTDWKDSGTIPLLMLVIWEQMNYYAYFLHGFLKHEVTCTYYHTYHIDSKFLHV